MRNTFQKLYAPLVMRETAKLIIKAVVKIITKDELVERIGAIEHAWNTRDITALNRLIKGAPPRMTCKDEKNRCRDLGIDGFSGKAFCIECQDEIVISTEGVFIPCENCLRYPKYSRAEA